MDRLPELPAMMDNASKALELLAAGTVALIMRLQKNLKTKNKNKKPTKQHYYFYVVAINIITNNI